MNYPGPTLLDFGDQMGTGLSNVAIGRSLSLYFATLPAPQLHISVQQAEKEHRIPPQPQIACVDSLVLLQRKDVKGLYKLPYNGVDSVAEFAC
jgi:hypothetical protein